MNRADILETWNPRTVTPTFFVLDRDCRTIAVERGLGAASMLAKRLEQSADTLNLVVATRDAGVDEFDGMGAAGPVSNL